MTVEHRKIDLSTWQGPMTVVGYPDLSVLEAHRSAVYASLDKTLSDAKSGNHSEHRKLYRKHIHK